MVKGPQRNAVFFYITENVMKRFTHRMSFTEALAIANPEWKNLSTDQRAPYKEMEKADKAKRRGAEGDKYRKLNTGENKAEFFAEKEKERRLEEQNELLSRNSIPIETNSARNRHWIVIIDFEYMVVTNDRQYYPAEIAIIRYSLESGIADKEFHHLFCYNDDNPLPSGMFADAISHSDIYHGVPVFPEPEFFSKYKPQYNIVALYSTLQSFLDPDSSGTAAPLFCRPDRIEQVRSCISWLHQQSGSSTRFDVIMPANIAVQRYLESGGHCMGKHEMEERLEKPTHLYSEGTICKYHCDTNKACCALGNVKCIAYGISEICCEKLKVDMTIRHSPTVKFAPKKEQPWSNTESNPSINAPWGSGASDGGWGGGSTDSGWSFSNNDGGGRDEKMQVVRDLVSDELTDVTDNLQLNGGFGRGKMVSCSSVLPPAPPPYQQPVDEKNFHPPQQPYFAHPPPMHGQMSRRGRGRGPPAHNQQPVGVAYHNNPPNNSPIMQAQQPMQPPQQRPKFETTGCDPRLKKATWQQMKSEKDDCQSDERESRVVGLGRGVSRR